MAEIHKKRPFISPKVGVLIAIAAIMIVVILVLFYSPPEGETNNVTGDAEMTPTVSITNLIETADINHNVTIQGVQVTLTKAMIATKFSDDKKRNGAYTLRVMAKTENKGQSVVGIDYASIVQLVLPGGEVIKPKLVSVKPAEYPGHPQTGFFDFPLSTQIPLSSLTLRFDNTAVPLK